MLRGFNISVCCGLCHVRHVFEKLKLMPLTPRLGVVMDPIADIKFAKDSTLAMLLAAQARGFELAYLEQGDLSLRDGVAFGRTRSLTVKADPETWFALGEPRVEPLGELDCILMRK